jgi:hypothetical protein
VTSSSFRPRSDATVALDEASTNAFGDELKLRGLSLAFTYRHLASEGEDECSRNECQK